jgi:putative membrane protein
MGWYDNGHMGAGGWIVMILAVSLFWAALIFGGIMFFRSIDGRGGRERARSDERGRRDPVDILDERLARGDLEIEEYEARKAVLRGAKR